MKNYLERRKNNGVALWNCRVFNRLFCVIYFIGSEENTCYCDVHSYEPVTLTLRHNPINKHVSVGDDVLVKKLDDLKSGTVIAVNKESAVVVMVDGAEEAFDNSLIYKTKE